ncbi:T9SS sorting signal type C domain-containing protein [Flavobacterium sp. 25HG05S-40]|uniref:T9SS sorting signal type C domain-containing protein n=1 Tax=Flavobacterium sp. 25HG05S-40 TaxID=3458682 RepID=UPI004043F905
MKIFTKIDAAFSGDSFNKLRASLVLVFVLAFAASGNAQLLQQDFSSSTTVSSYVNATTPTNGQFNAISTSGAGTVLSINTTTSNKLRFARTANAGAFSRTSDFSPTPGSMLYRFDIAVSGNSVAQTTAGTLQVGSGYGTANSAEASASTHSRLGVNWTATAGQFSLRNLTGSTNTANYTGTQTVLWAINNSGATLTYRAPDGTYETVANDTYDLWIGTTKEFNDIAATTASISLTDLKFAMSNGTGNVDFDNILIDPIPAVPTSSAATAIGSAGFTANWTAVSGVTGYRVDVATDAAFTSLVSGYNNLYVSGQATNSLNVTGLSQTTTYYYRVRAASQYTVGEFAGANSASQNLTTTSASGIDGVITANEYGTHTNGNNQQSSATGTWYMNWDATNLYIGLTGTNTAEGTVLYLDKNPITPVNGGTNADGNLTGYNNYDGSNFANLQFRADMVVYFKDGYREYRTADGSGGWSSPTAAFGSYASASGTKEVAIPWSALGGMPAAFNWFGYVAYSGGGAYASVPTENPGSGAGTTIGASARWDRYYTVSSTTSGTTPPFSRNSYTFTSASDVSSFGAINAYDFTMNSSGRFVSRTGSVAGNWAIAGNLTVGAGTIYLGSGPGVYGTTAVSGNLNLLGGTYDMDATTATTSVTGNVAIASGATLKLSTQVGGDLNVAGNWSNSGTFTPSSRLVQFNGTLAQTLTGASTFDFLTLNNSLGLTLVNNVTVNQTLALTSGKITLGANNLTVGASGSITASSTNYLVTNSTGQLKRTVGAGAVTFPVGNTAYNPIILNNTGGTSDVYGINVLDGTYATPFDNTKVVNRRWQVSEAVAGGSNLSVVGQYNTADTFGSNFAGGTTPLIGFYNGASWSTVVATAAGSNPFTYTSTTNATPSDLTSGTQYFGLGKDNGFVSVATKLVITSISPASPSATGLFNVTVQAQDAYNIPTTVIAGTTFDLTTNGNAGAIGGTVSGTILAATNSIVVSGVTLATAGTGVTLTATRNAGDVLTAGTSATFTVLGAPTQLAFVGTPATGNAGVNLASFTVEVRRADNSVDTNYTGTVVLTKASGLGTLSGTTSVAAVAGVATFNAIQFDAAGTYTLNANSGSLTQATSGSIVVTLSPVSIYANTITGTSPGNTSPYTTGQTFNSNITVSGVVRGAGISGATGNDRYTNTNWTLSTSIDNDDYIELSLTPGTGYSINFENLIFTNQRSGSGPTKFAVRSSLNSFSTDLGVYTNTGNNIPSTETLSLSGVDFDDVSSPITFRIYGYSATNAGGTGSINDFIFNGNVVCTQPTAYAVTGGGAYCSGGSGVVVGLANSQLNITYQLKIGGVDTGSPVAGTGSAISFGPQTAVGTYTVEATNANAPCNYSTTMSGSAVIASVTTTTTDGGITWDNGTPSSATTAVFDGSTGTIGADFSACALSLVNNAVVSVTSGFNVTLTGAVSVQSGSSFTLNNNANLFQGGTTNNNTGNIIVKRNSATLKRLDYTLWSSPVTGQGLYAFSPFTFANRFYVYNPSTDLYAGAGLAVTGTNPDGVNGTDSNNVPFAVGTSYLIRMPWNHPTAPTSWTGIFTGIPNNGTVTLSSLNNGSYYAIGNPYPSTIDADTFIGDNNIGDNPLTPGDGLYFWRKTNNNAAPSYATYTTAGGVASGGDTLNIIPNGTIQVGQGFIVKATSTSIEFNNLQRIPNNDNQFLRTTTIERNRIWLNLSDATTSVNQMMVAYMTGATQGIDAAIDGRYFNDNPTALNSFLNNEEFAIQGRSLPFDASDVVPLAFKAATAGNYSIAIDHVDGLFADGAQDIYLKDNLAGTVHDLNSGAYSFASTEGSFNNRFEIVFQSQLGIENPGFTANNVIIYSQNNNFVINSGETIMKDVKVFDIRGRLLQEKSGVNSNQTTISGGLSNQVLLVQITSDNGVTVTKKVIR